MSKQDFADFFRHVVSAKIDDFQAAREENMAKAKARNVPLKICPCCFAMNYNAVKMCSWCFQDFPRRTKRNGV